MSKIYVVVNTKGGVGKSTLSWHVLPALLSHLGKSFKIFEVDNNNISNIYEQSDIIKDNTKNLKTHDKNIAAEIIFETLTSTDDIVIDSGGGTDSLQVIDIVKSVGQDVEVRWLIPINQNLAQLKNAIDTYQKIDDPSNTFFVLNGYRDLSQIENEFVFYFGNSNMNLQSIRSSLNIQMEFKVPFSNLFELAELQNYTIGDLACIARELPKEKAKAFFFEKFSNNRSQFLKAWNDYQNSELAGIVLERIFADFLPFFDENLQISTHVSKKSTKVN